MYKQIIIARKDLEMSPGKLAAQVSHASNAFLIQMIEDNVKKVINEQILRAYDSDGRLQWYRHPDLDKFAEVTRQNGKRWTYYKPVNPKNPYGKQVMVDESTVDHYKTEFTIDKELYEQWMCGEYTKCVLRAKNKNQLLKAKTMAEDLGMGENKDFWLIYDNCHTELEPEEDGRTLTVIGFKPMDGEVIDQIGKKYQLYT